MLASAFEMVPAMALIWLIHLCFTIPALLLWAFCRGGVSWRKWEYSLLVVPYWLWALLFMSGLRGKDWINLYEALAIGAAISVAAAARAFYRTERLAVPLYVACVLFSVVLWLMAPGISCQV